MDPKCDTFEVQRPSCEGQSPGYKGPVRLWDIQYLRITHHYRHSIVTIVSVRQPIHRPVRSHPAAWTPVTQPIWDNGSSISWPVSVG